MSATSQVGIERTKFDAETGEAWFLMEGVTYGAEEKLRFFARDRSSGVEVYADEALVTGGFRGQSLTCA